MFWAVQSNLVNEEDVKAMQRAVEARGKVCHLFKGIPFSDEIPDIPTDDQAVFYGGIHTVEKVRQSGKWSPAVFYEPEVFQYSEYERYYGEHLINHGCEFTTLGKLAAEKRPHDSLWFVRPVADDKSFPGDVFEFSTLMTWKSRLEPQNPYLSPETPIIVSEPVGISGEWRIFIVDGKFCSGSRYRTYMRWDRKGEVPKEVRDFSEAMAAIWSPSRIFVLDVAMSGGDCYVLEVGSFNSAGFYLSNVEKIVSDITDFVEQSG
jgi:hypothetical protein